MTVIKRKISVIVICLAVFLCMLPNNERVDSMSLTKLTANTNNISLLADLPNATSGLTAAQLKAEFDKAGNAIKTYVNETLTEEIDAGFVTKTDLTTNRKLSATGDFTGTLDGYLITAVDPAVSSTVNGIIADIKTQDLATLMLRLPSGTPLKIGLYGDSIYAGWDGSIYVSEKIDATMQYMLRSYNNNTAATVVNNAVQGTGTNSELPGWAATMAASTEDIVIINYGVNDAQGTPENPAITAGQYRVNLIEMVRIAKENGKVVVLDTPNFVLRGSGRSVKSETVKQFARVMRDVAKYTNCELIDSTYWLEKLLESKPNLGDWIPDGIHLSQEANKWKARLLVSGLIQPNTTLSSKNEISGIASPKFDPNSTADYFGSVNSIVGAGVLSNKIRFGVFVEEPGLDLYMANMVWNTGTTLATIKVDGVSVGTTSMRDTDISATNNYVVDQEVLIAENVSIGYHFIEIDATGAEIAGLNYVRTYPTRQRTTFKGAANSFTYKEKVLESPIITVANAGYNTILTDIPMSRLTKGINVEVIATLTGNDGFALFGHKIGGLVGDTEPMAGLLVWLDGTTGFLNISEPSTPGAYTTTVKGAVDLKGVEQTYKIYCATNGTITLYVDGVSIGTYAQTKPYIGGFLGFWKAGAGTINVKSASIY